MKRIFIFIIFISQFSCSNAQNSVIDSRIKLVDTTRVKKNLFLIINTEQRRNYKNIESLNIVADYIKSELEKICDSVAFQEYEVDGTIYKNVIGSLGLENKKRIIIGAHYDVAGDSDGADDNASGVAGLLELARLLSKEKLKYRIDFVGYTLEEPPFFRTEQMGSYIHAKYINDNDIPLKGMISLETIGYYNDEPHSQDYPIKGMELMYGNKGDFITVVRNDKGGAFGKEIEKLMKEQSLISTKSFKGSSLLPGVDFSDHLNYWNLNYDAIMITNTAFYRNKRYHTSLDTLETLNIEKMSLVIEELYLALKQLK